MMNKNKIKTIAIRVDEPLYKWIKRRCKQYGGSMSEEVRRIIVDKKNENKK